MKNNALVFAHSGKGGLQAARFLLLFPANQPRNTAAQHRGIHSKESHDQHRFPATTRGKWKQVFTQKRRLRPLTEDPPRLPNPGLILQAGRTQFHLAIRPSWGHPSTILKTYDTWLAKLRKRASPSGALSQWAEQLSRKQGGDAGMWREHLREILEGDEKASLDLILDLDLISAPVRKESGEDKQIPLW